MGKVTAKKANKSLARKPTPFKSKVSKVTPQGTKRGS